MLKIEKSTNCLGKKLWTKRNICREFRHLKMKLLMKQSSIVIKKKQNDAKENKNYY